MKVEFSKMNADLFSGTAWCFTGVNNRNLPFPDQKPVCDQKLDYIFIDEAGQLSIACTVKFIFNCWFAFRIYFQNCHFS